MILWHGGVPGLRVGDLVTGGNTRPAHAGCPICAERAAGTSQIDPPIARPDRVYVTTSREYARHYASLYGFGDLYRVEADELEASLEDSIETYTTPAATIVAVYDRAVMLTWSRRRALWREWAAADAVSLGGAGRETPRPSPADAAGGAGT